MPLLPRISDTEREALEAGTVWVDGEFFSGRPDFRRMLAEPYPELSQRERAFLDGPVEEVCRMVDPWELNRRRDLPPRSGPSSNGSASSASTSPRSSAASPSQG